MAPARAQGLSPSELQTASTANAYYPATHTESVTRFASNGFSIFHIACLFMANDQFQSATPAQSCLLKLVLINN